MYNYAFNWTSGSLRAPRPVNANVMHMNKLSSFVIVLLLTACVGNPWQQFLGNIQMFVGKDFRTLKNELASGGRKELTSPDGYILPNGNKQHEFFWLERNQEQCILLVEVNAETNRVASVGGKGGTKACQWGG